MTSDDINIITVVFNFFITGFFYELIPLIARFYFKDKYSKKEAIKAAVTNSIFVYIMFSIVHLVFLKDGLIANMGAACIWGFISYSIIPKKEMDTNIDEENIKVDKQNN